MTATECAEWLTRIAHDVRTAGDMRVVRFTEDGVEDAMTLSDELSLVALNLDYEASMATAKDLRERHNS